MCTLFGLLARHTTALQTHRQFSENVSGIESRTPEHTQTHSRRNGPNIQYDAHETVVVVKWKSQIM